MTSWTYNIKGSEKEIEREREKWKVEEHSKRFQLENSLTKRQKVIENKSPQVFSSYIEISATKKKCEKAGML